MTKKIEVVDAPVLRAAAETPPTVAMPDPLSAELVELLPPLDPAVRARFVDALADLALGELADGDTDAAAKE